MALRVFVFFALGLTLLAGEATACDCRGGITPCQEYFEASAVFVGVVTGSSRATLDQGDHQFPQRLFQFRLEQAYRGIAGKEVSVITGMGNGDCGYDFRVGEKYLVYAFRTSDNKLSTSICTRTRLFSEAQEDLDYIRGLSTAPRGSIIFGEVNRVNRNSSDERLTPVEGAKISIVGSSKRVEVITDSKGQYSAAELPPGAYKVKLNLPEGLSIYDPEREANVSDRGCARVGFWVEADTRITGKVFDLQGQPIPNVLLELVPAKPAPNQLFPQFVRTDSEGKYEMKLVKGGRYLLGVRIYGSAGSTYVPYRRTYYPGVFEESQATVITIAEGQVINAVDLHLPPPLIERELEGIVTFTDEQPAKGATVWLKEIEYPNNDMPYRATTDDQGRFSFKVYEGMKYSLVAIIDSETKGKQKRSDALEIRATETTEVIKLMINRADSP
jgi:hypothetical protein